jgi:hypothetical protein
MSASIGFSPDLTRRAGLLRGIALLTAAATPWPHALSASVGLAEKQVNAGRRWAAGPGTGQTLAQALGRAGPGDTVLIHGDLHGETAVVEQPGLTLRGAGGLRTLHSAGRSAEGKAILVVRAPGVRIAELGFAGARVRDGNGAGIRLEDGSLTVTDCHFTDNEMGLLTSNRGELALALHDCRFANAPRHAGPLHHLLYVGRIGRFDLRGCTLGNGFRGHLVKSRARLAVLVGNRLDDGTAGQASYELELAEGGRALVAGNVLVQSPGSGNAAVLSVGAEATPQAQPTEVWLLHNTFVHRGTAGTLPARFVHWWGDRLGADATLYAFDNLLLGPGAPGLAAAAAEGGNFIAPVVPPDLTTADRAALRRAAAAGWQSAPLPPPPPWLPTGWPWANAAGDGWRPPQGPGALPLR